MHSGSAISQEKLWTVDECMLYAVKNSPKTNKQIEQNSIYHQNYLEAIGRLLPKISASSNAYFNFGRGVDSETNTYTDINSFSNNYSLYGSLTLFDGLSNINKIKVEKINKLMGKHQLQQTKDVLSYETMEAYFNVIYYQQMVALAKEQLTESSNNLSQVQRMEELGVKGFPDVAEMQAKKVADNYNLTKQKNILAIGIIILKEKMNFPLDEDIQITEYSSSTLITKTNESALEIYTHSLAYTPKSLVAEATVEAAKKSYQSAKGGLLPTISVDGGYSSNFSRYMDGTDYISFKQQLKDKRGYYVGFSISIPIFSGFSRSANVKRSKANVAIAQAEYEETQRSLYSEIEQAVTDMNGQSDEYYQAKEQVEAMQIAHNVNQKKYSEGLVSPIELHTSANRLLQAKTEEINALLKYQLKQRLVNYYKGEPFIVEK